MSKNRKQTKINKKLRDAREEAEKLRQQWGDLSVENVRLSSEILRMKARLDQAGFAAKTIDEPCHGLQVIKVDIVPFAKLAVTQEQLNFEELKELKEMCVESIVKELLENDLVQFCYRGPWKYNDPLDEREVYMAKLFVIPWEQARLGTHFVEVKT